jgi:toxin-antitoxin system PIN domain toxin
MRSLFDVNFLIALLDQAHAFHERAHAWWGLNHGAGWASCPIVENGVVRIMTHPHYTRTRRLAPGQVLDALRAFAASADHAFWPDALSLRDGDAFDPRHVLGPRQVTDVYLLGLAVRHGGRLVTFDAAIPRQAVRGSDAMHLCVV